MRVFPKVFRFNEIVATKKKTYPEHPDLSVITPNPQLHKKAKLYICLMALWYPELHAQVRKRLPRLFTRGYPALIFEAVGKEQKLHETAIELLLVGNS